MRFWRRRRRELTEAERARLRAELELERTRQETAQYAELAARVREIRERNHLTDLFLNLHHGRGN